MIQAKFIDEHKTDVKITGNGFHICNELEAILGTFMTTPELRLIFEIAIDSAQEKITSEKN